MSKFTAAQLVELANGIYAGAELEHLTDSGWTVLGTKAETVDALLHSWRIKPAKKIIDMAHFIKSGIDMEFWDVTSMYLGVLNAVMPLNTRPYISKKAPWKHCRPRLNHPHFHKGGICPVPEGFRGNIYLRNDSISSKIYIADFTHYRWDLKYQRDDAIACEILGLADGWIYPWEVEA